MAENSDYSKGSLESRCFKEYLPVNPSEEAFKTSRAVRDLRNYLESDS